jgi:6,7-dimethyl-8-ribityllumazine synthase
MVNQSAVSSSGERIAFVKARWHADIVDRGHAGFAADMQNADGGSVEVDVFEVPGAFEIPLLVRDLLASGRYVAAVACAFVVDGGIYRHEFVAQAVVSALMQVQLEVGRPVFSVVLTPRQFHATEEHQRFFLDHLYGKGQEAAAACLAVLHSRKALLPPMSESG